MAITSISIYQDNKIGDSDLMPVHSPLIFLADAVYTATDPYFIYCKVYNASNQLLGTFKCIPYRDITSSQRRFMFIADGILPGLMEEYEDFAQTENTLVYVPDITKVFKLRFEDPDNSSTFETTIITAVHGAAQFGSNPNFVDIYNNEDENVTAIKGIPAYVYFYNNDTSNSVSVDQESFIRFIVSDSVGFVQDAKVELPTGGETKYTNSNGEVTFFGVAAGSIGYKITKYGYDWYIDSITVLEDATQIIEITLTAKSLSTVTFNVYDVGGSPVLSGIGISIKWGGVLIDSGTTNGSGQYITSLYEYNTPPWNDKYNIQCTDTLDYFETLRTIEGFIGESITAPTDIINRTAVENTVVITFEVKTTGGTPISGATIGLAGHAWTGDPTSYLYWTTALLTTNGSGQASWTARKGFATSIGVRATGYASKVQSISVGQINKTVEIIMT